MNDFTKDELYFMFETFRKDYFYHRKQDDFGVLKDLLKKIQKMADEYCEHPSWKYTHDVSAFKCNKCKRTI